MNLKKKGLKDFYHESEIPPELMQYFEEIEPQTEPCVVADIFFGSGTTAIVAQQNDRRWIGIDLSPEYCDLAKKRITKEAGQYSQMQLI